MDSQEQPIDNNEQSPSNNYGSFTDSQFSDRHLNSDTRKIRTSPWYLTAANLTKMYVGIAFISTPKAISSAGLIGAVLGFIFTIYVNAFCLNIFLKARNRFKKEEIVDMGDLASKLYGPWAKILISILIIFNNSLFLLCYIIFIGLQTDQLVCKTFKKADCGYQHAYSAIILLILLPVLMIKRLKYIGYFSIFILFFTFIAIIIIIVICSRIIGMSPQELKDAYELDESEYDRDYNYWDTLMIPVFCATIMTLFEGNQQILNIYAEFDKPKNFFMLSFILILSLTVFVAATVGYVGYLAFGSKVKSVILLNLPNSDPSAITAKICYILTIMGSFVLLINPIYYIIENTECFKGKNYQDGNQELTCLQIFKYIFWRTFVVLLAYTASIFCPSIHLILTFAGAILGTIISILIPVLFYNKAYAFTEKNQKFEKLEEKEQLLSSEDSSEQSQVQKTDKRRCVKICSWITLAVGLLVGGFGFAFVVISLKDGKNQGDAN